MPKSAGMHISIRNVLFGLAGALAAMLTFRAPYRATDGMAHATGQFVGGLLFVFGVPLLLRLVYVKVIRRKAGGSVWSGWVLVMAFLIAFTAVVSAAGANLRAVEEIKEEVARDGDVGGTLALKYGVVSAASDVGPLERCVGWLMSEYEAASPTERRPFTAATAKTWGSRVCVRVAEAGLLLTSGKALGPRDEVVAIRLAVMRQMQRAGELPSG